MRLAENIFDDLVKEGEELEVAMDEITRLQEIQVKMKSWKRAVSKALDDIWNHSGESTDESTDRLQYKILFELYL